MRVSWLCPVCHKELQLRDGVWACQQGHAYDQAREGYVNLLVGRQKSGLKGDTPAMLAARSRFLAAGYYAPLRAGLIEKVSQIEHTVVAEIGCGQGYYIGGISEHFFGSKCLCLGTDIAKEGVRQAARMYPSARFAVADTNLGLPLPEASVDVLLNIFAPRNSPEFARVVKPGGRVLVVIPTQRHLAELREIQPLLSIQPQKRQAVVANLARQFQLVRSEYVTVPLKLNEAAVTDLVEMTPNAWFLTDEQRGRLRSVEAVKVTAAFEVLEFRHLDRPGTI